MREDVCTNRIFDIIYFSTQVYYTTVQERMNLPDAGTNPRDISDRHYTFVEKAGSTVGTRSHLPYECEKCIKMGEIQVVETYLFVIVFYTITLDK